ncbi:hypothetical protein [Nakamurella endophytica]|uniref:hypothetical protein n=1 Tax=Nakamurella endophytica TaxID=1748367 RepID=UPI00166979BF|nr:hypothetical protein [Nakamurella endophytica]
MDRRVAGWWVVVLTVVGMLAAAVVLGPAVTGGAVRGPVPDPPDTGSCMAREASGLVSTPCDRPHTAEVALAWSAGLGRPPGKDAYAACTSAASAYIGADVSNTAAPTADDTEVATGWRPPALTFAIELAHGPTADLVPGYSWQVCLVRPTVGNRPVGSYTGTARGINTTQDRPVLLRSCYARAGQVMSTTPCDQPHAGELLAIQNVRVPDGDPEPADDPRLAAQCRAIARNRTGATDATYGRRLAAVVSGRDYGLGIRTSAAAAERSATVGASYVAYHVSCAVEIRGAARLTASVIGLGQASLPVG